jgi:transcriptional regulator with XRE-family HTH domain
MITGRQIRAARGLLGWDAIDLATKAGLTRETVSKIENETVQAREDTLGRILHTFNNNGIDFIDNEGVRLKPTGITTYDGLDAFQSFYDFMYEHLNQFGGDVCLSIYDETILAKLRKNPEIHRERMRELTKRGNVTFRAVVTKSEFSTHDYLKLRRLPNQYPVSTGFYAFGECLALMSFVNPASPYVIVINSGPMTQAYREGFNIAWENAEEPPTKATISVKASS